MGTARSIVCQLPFSTTLCTPHVYVECLYMSVTLRPNHEQVAHNLLEAGANVNHQTPKHVTALNLACENGHKECAVLLLRAGARADIADDWGDTPLSIAEKKGMDTVLALMQ